MDRRHNRSGNRGTINQDKKASDPKWENIGGGILKLKVPMKGKNGYKGTNYIRLQGSKFVSVTRKEVNQFLSVPNDAIVSALGLEVVESGT